MRIVAAVFLGLIGLLMAGLTVTLLSPVGQRLLPVSTGLAAKQACSLVFVSGLDLAEARRLYLDPVLQPGSPHLTITVDRSGDGAVRASLRGLFERRAIHRPGLGCTLLSTGLGGQSVSSSLPPVQGVKASAPSPMRLDARHRDAIFEPGRLENALTSAFEEPSDGAPLNTLAVVVLHQGRLVAEAYADAITPQTRLPGWSMAKSVTATLAGLLVERGEMDVSAQGALSRWQDTEDPRGAITMDHLLRMTSGLELTETQSGLDPASQMLFLEADQAAFAATRDLITPVGSTFAYMSGSTVLAMRGVQDVMGPDPGRAWASMQTDLFLPLGMGGAILEPDEAGTFIGSSFMLASAREWARFGALYASGGIVRGRRVLSRSWIDYVTTPTASGPHVGGATYGAGFWLQGKEWGNRWGDQGEKREDGQLPLPADLFWARGFQGQAVAIIPSARLVVVRLGATFGRQSGVEDLVRDVLGAMRTL